MTINDVIGEFYNTLPQLIMVKNLTCRKSMKRVIHGVISYVV